jgi:hypothetical protein
MEFFIIPIAVLVIVGAMGLLVESLGDGSDC